MQVITVGIKGRVLKAMRKMGAQARERDPTFPQFRTQDILEIMNRECSVCPVQNNVKREKLPYKQDDENPGLPEMMIFTHESLILKKLDYKGISGGAFVAREFKCPEPGTFAARDYMKGLDMRRWGGMEESYEIGIRWVDDLPKNEIYEARGLV